MDTPVLADHPRITYICSVWMQNAAKWTCQKTIDDRDGWGERVKEFPAVSVTWWYIYTRRYTHTLYISYTHIYMLLGLVVFWSISNLVGYSKPDTVYIYIYIWMRERFLSEVFIGNIIFKRARAYLFARSKWLRVFLSNTYNYLHTVKWFQVLLCNTTNSI